MFNAAGQKIGAVGNYPEGPEAYTDLERVDAYRAIPASNGNDRFAVCHFFTDLIDIYSDSGKAGKTTFMVRNISLHVLRSLMMVFR